MKNLLLSFMIIGAVFFTNTFAGDNPRAVIIFDASGSMWGQIEGKSKIEIAKEALKNVVNEWNPSVELGLTVYGHRSKGDCDDIETVIAVGVVDKPKIISTVMNIQPKGKTPISRSLRKVANEIKYTEEKATIILISDGQETCDADPCATAKELEKEGIDFITHVIGFNVDKKTDKQLECIASATGGAYFSAKNATALNEAIKVIAKKVEVVKPKPIPKPVVKKLENNLEVTTSEKEGGKWVKCYNRIHKDENGKAGESVGVAHSGTKRAGTNQIPVGKYILKSTYNDFKKETAFEIKAGELTKIHVVMGETGTVEVTTSEKEGGKWVKCYNRIHKDENGKAGDSVGVAHSGTKRAGTNQIPVGKYILKSTYNDFKKETAFEIKAGEVTKIHVVMGETGTIEVTTSEKEGGKWVKCYNRIHKDENGKAGESVGVAHSGTKRAGTNQIPVGKYILKSTYNDFKKETAFEIKAGEVTKLHIIFSQFVIESKCSDMNAKVSYEIYASTGQLIYDKKIKCSDALSVTLDKGDYSIEAKIDNITKEKKFTVGGDATNLTIDMMNK